MGATVNRVGTDVSVGVATVTEQAAKQAGSVAGTAVTVTGSIVAGGASLVADGVVTLASAATGPSRHMISRPAPGQARPGSPGTKPDDTADEKTEAPPRRAGSGQRRGRAGPATAAATRPPAPSKTRRTTKST